MIGAGLGLVSVGVATGIYAGCAYATSQDAKALIARPAHVGAIVGQPYKSTATVSSGVSVSGVLSCCARLFMGGQCTSFSTTEVVERSCVQDQQVVVQLDRTESPRTIRLFCTGSQLKDLHTTRAKTDADPSPPSSTGFLGRNYSVVVTLDSTTPVVLVDANHEIPAAGGDGDHTTHDLSPLTEVKVLPLATYSAQIQEAKAAASATPAAVAAAISLASTAAGIWCWVR